MTTGLDRLKNAFVEALGISPNAAFDELEYARTPGWDSVAHMKLIADIELEFDIMLDTDDVIDMSSFPIARKIVAKYGVSLD